jgi:DNA (cytosine-5)-methyltransferase 1
MAAGMAGDSLGHWHIAEDGMVDRVKQDTAKPPYTVPSMAEVRAIPWNGLKVVSTFSGAGGSCTGYRMAGYRVVWANEFVPAAQASYKANASEYSFLDTRDIKLVTPRDILTQTGLRVGELDLFDGSPPCQAFSTAGRREKNWGKDKRYEHGATQKNETLFDEYIRLLRGLKPKVFVAENVSGLVKGTAKGYFLDILAALKASGYRVICKVLDAQWLGVPQRRQRTIFVGVRGDLGIDPVHPKPFTYRYTVRDALPWLTNSCAGSDVEMFKPKWGSVDKPSPTIMAGGAHGGSGELRYSVEEGTKASAIEKTIYDLTRPGGSFDEAGPRVGYRGGFSRIRVDTQKACPAVTTNLDLFHPTERRKFSIAELKRLCAFPDDFVLTGTYPQQWARLGNSVPPLMMKSIAEAIRDRIFVHTISDNGAEMFGE